MISTDKTASAPNPENENSGQARKLPDATEQIQIAVQAALERKAERIQVLNLGKISDFTDYFFICSGSNERQVQAIGDAVRRSLRKAGIHPLHSEGQNTGRWILLDFGGDLVIHIFLDETRRHYGLERLWGDAPDETERFLENLPSA